MSAQRPSREDNPGTIVRGSRDRLTRQASHQRRRGGGGGDVGATIGWIEEHDEVDALEDVIGRSRIASEAIGAEFDRPGSIYRVADA